MSGFFAFRKDWRVDVVEIGVFQIESSAIHGETEDELLAWRAFRDDIINSGFLNGVWIESGVLLSKCKHWIIITK